MQASAAHGARQHAQSIHGDIDFMWSYSLIGTRSCRDTWPAMIDEEFEASTCREGKWKLRVPQNGVLCWPVWYENQCCHDTALNKSNLEAYVLHVLHLKTTRKQACTG